MKDISKAVIATIISALVIAFFAICYTRVIPYAFKEIANILVTTEEYRNILIRNISEPKNSQYSGLYCQWKKNKFDCSKGKHS